jgi:acetyl-CoA synthase
MSKLIATRAIQGAHKLVARAESELRRSLAQRPPDTPVRFPNTAYYLPISYGILGMKIETLAGLQDLLVEARKLLPPVPAEEVWLPYLGHTLDAGMATLFADEIIEGIKYTESPLPYWPEANPSDGNPWLGAANDVIMRARGIEFVDGSAPGFAACVGYCRTNADAVKIARELQQKNLYVFLAAGTDSNSMAAQLREEGVQLGWDTRLVPLGDDVTACIHALGFATRVALSFGGAKPGDFQKILSYNKNRVFAFVLALGQVDDEKHAQAAGAINFGFPTIAETDIGQILPSGICTYEHVVSNVPYENMVEKALEVRGCKVTITRVPIPVPYGPAFEGERIRKADMHVEFGGNQTPAFEFVTSAGLEEINDGDIKVIGPEIDAVPEGSALPLAIWIEVAGRKMQPDFEPILERQVHHLLNGAEGLWHMGQRDIIWTRVSKAGFSRGLRLRHYGEIIHAKFLSEYPAIVDKVKVTLITVREEVERRIAMARKVYDERNRRLESMTDESVDTFYSCLLCQSFAPTHVCMITPERLGLCGAYNWLDGKAAFEINENGPNKPVKKGHCLDPVKGIWQGVNDYVYANSHRSIAAFSAYSIMDRPMTSCGCFEVICAYVPECNGIMAVNREYQGNTPVGMTFSALAGTVGGGQQTPGFMGCGKVFLTSKKFLFADGGHRRLVWMTKELKDLLGNDLGRRLAEQGAPDLLEKIADDTMTTDSHAVREFMERVHHPALKMEDMLRCAESAPQQAETARVRTDLQTRSTIIDEIERTALEIRPHTGSESSDLAQEIASKLKGPLTKEIVEEIIQTLSRKFLVAKSAAVPETRAGEMPALPAAVVSAPKSAERIGKISAFEVRKEISEVSVWTVKLGASKKEGGTRGKTYIIGGETCMPFHLWEGQMPHRPLVAMEVFDRVSEKYPGELRKLYGELLDDPAAMARVCVERYGADLISVRLDGTHPERGNRSPQQSVQLVKAVLEAVEVPLIITGHNHYESINEVMKTIAQAFAGENLLLNWVEQDNYRTIAGAALGYGHSVVSQSPIDVNISKQMNILLGNMELKPERIVIDPMTCSTGYGIEYTYSIMERIRSTGLSGDNALAAPMLVSPGQECSKIKESRALEKDFTTWGNLSTRVGLWEFSTALSLLYAGADLLIMYHPEAAMQLKKKILELMNG